VVTNPAPDLVLTSTAGKSRPIHDWLTVFHMLFVAVDPANHQSSWIVPTAARILTNYDDADCRVAWVVAGYPEDARRLLGRWATDILTFSDPQLTAIKGFGLERLPAIVHLGIDGAVVNAVEGWDPPAWHDLTVTLSDKMRWSRPVIPLPKDPGPFPGAPLPKR